MAIVLPDSEISFFGAEPTYWNLLTEVQQSACTGPRIACQILEHFAWSLSGKLLDQWNKSGIREYRAVKDSVKRGRKVSSPALYLLSPEDDPRTAIPVIVITCKEYKIGKTVIELFEKHERLASFQIPCRWRRGDMRLPALAVSGGDHDHPVEVLEDNNGFNASERPLPGSGAVEDPIHEGPTYKITLCGAKIAVYTGPQTFRNPKRNTATITGLIQVGQTRYALTAAHVFFSNVNTNGSWIESSLTVNTNSRVTDQDRSTVAIDSAHTDIVPERPDPLVNQTYNVVIESFWPHTHGSPEDVGISPNAIGEVSPRFTRERKDLVRRTLPEVVFDFRLDCALIEIRDSTLWLPNVITLGQDRYLTPFLPEETDPSARDPPTGRVLMAAGISGLVEGVSLGTVGGIVLPWKDNETPAWSIQAEIAVGDSGALTMSPESGLSLGLVVSYDPSIGMTYVVPMNEVLAFIRAEAGPDISFAPHLPQKKITTEAPDMMHPKYSAGPAYESSESRKPATARGKSSVFDDFLAKLEQCTVRNVFGTQFVLTRQLTDWLLSISKVHDGVSISQVDRLLDFVYADKLIVPITGFEIARHGCLLIFSMLLKLRHGHLIDVFRRFDLRDSRFPLHSADQLDAVSTKIHQSTDSAKKLIQELFDLQWIYFPFKFDDQMAASLHPSIVLPIIQRQQINKKGATADIWEVTIPKELVGSELQELTKLDRFEDPKDNRGLRYTFAIKSFPSQYEKIFKAEREAFRLMRRNPAFVRCFGDFTQHEDSRGLRHNLLLEYGECDLAEYYAIAPPMVLPTQIWNFWSNMLNIVKAVRDLHMFNVQRLSSQTTLYGWHHDIKPDNILIVKGTFKLADPGFAHFSKGKESKGLVKGGTLNYGPPESSVGIEENTILGRSADIWSLGCVFSEAATWIVLGNHGLQQYENFRRNAQQAPKGESTEESGPVATGRFHSGSQISAQVREWHRMVRDTARSTDQFASPILHLVESHLLQAKSEARMSASALYNEVARILHDHRAVESSYSKLLLDHVSYKPVTYSRLDPKSMGPATAMRPTGSMADVSGGSVGAIDRTVPSTDVTQQVIRPPNIPILEPQVYSAVRESDLSSFSLSRATRNDIFDEYCREEDESKFGHRISRVMTSRRSTDQILAVRAASRNFVFLIDNAASMASQWSKLRFLWSVLSRKVRSLDANGISIEFTLGDKPFAARKRSNNIKHLNDALLHGPIKDGITDITKSLQRIFDSYLELYQSPKGPVPILALAILTDGLCMNAPALETVENVITTFATKILSFSNTRPEDNERLSIEFIWFGTDHSVQSWIKRLGDILNSRGLPLTVDVEPWYGSVFNMILGRSS